MHVYHIFWLFLSPPSLISIPLLLVPSLPNMSLLDIHVFLFDDSLSFSRAVCVVMGLKQPAGASEWVHNSLKRVTNTPPLPKYINTQQFKREG